MMNEVLKESLNADELEPSISEEDSEAPAV